MSQKPTDKKSIKCLFISKLREGNSLYDFGLITDNFEFYSCEIQTRSPAITTHLWIKLRQTFKPFQITAKTDVMLSNVISVYEPISYYFKILQEQLHFSMRFVDPLQIPRRIATYHTSYLGHKKLQKISKSDIERLWIKVLENNDCPWITTDVDRTLRMSYSAYKYRLQFLRLAVYYMLIKQHFYAKLKNSAGYQRKKSSTLIKQNISEGNNYEA